MRLLINALPLRSTLSGIGTYIFQLSKNLESFSDKLQTSYFYGTSIEEHLRAHPSPAFRLFSKMARSSPLLSTCMHWCKERSFQHALLSKTIDIYHETNYVPMPYKGPIVITVFDLSLQRFPQTHPKNRVAFFERNFYRRLSWANHFIAPSHAIKAEMVKYLSLKEDQITVTPLGVHPLCTPISQQVAQPILSHYGLKHSSYVLYVGNLEARKNLGALLRAYALLPGRTRKQFPLVLAGCNGWLMDHLDQEIRQLGIASNTLVTGFIPAEHLPALYSGATTFVFPSLYEGFGLPVLEAMACGSPVIASNIPSLIELIGDAGLLFDPYDFHLLKKALEEMLETPSLQNILSKKGVEKARCFSWKTCAQQTLAVYSRVSQK